MRAPVRTLILPIVAWAALAAAPALAQAECPAGFVPLAESTPVSGTGAVCYRFEIPEASPFVRFEVDAGEALDLYFSEGLQESLSDWDRINVSPIEGDTKLVLLRPAAGDYTVAVAPNPEVAGYKLAAVAGGGAGEEPITICTDDGLCSTALPMKAGPQAIQLGSDFGDRVIFPITVPAPGKIEVTAHWAGAAERLALILDGPKRPELADPVAYYARSDGASPLTVTYTVTPEDLEHGRRFQVSLVNFSGGEAIGGIDIQAPEAFVFSHARLANLELGPMKPLKPVKPVKPVVVQPKQPVVVQPKKPVVARPAPGKVVQLKSQEQVCREGVQGKIAWNYQGNTSWAANNLERLCRGTTKGSEPARCFRHVMHGGVEWGGGTRWQWENALDLCEGTSDAARTIRCFEAGIKRGWSWQRAIDRCEPR